MYLINQSINIIDKAGRTAVLWIGCVSSGTTRRWVTAGGAMS